MMCSLGLAKGSIAMLYRNLIATQSSVMVYAYNGFN